MESVSVRHEASSSRAATSSTVTPWSGTTTVMANAPLPYGRSAAEKPSPRAKGKRPSGMDMKRAGTTEPSPRRNEPSYERERSKRVTQRPLNYTASIRNIT